MIIYIGLKSLTYIIEKIVIVIIKNQYKMKISSALFILFLLSIGVISCRNNRLKTDEEKLKNELLNTGGSDLSTGTRISSDTSQVRNGIMYGEDRSVDPQQTPLVIDIAGSLSRIKEISLSEVASEIRYIRIQPPPDSTFKNFIGFRYYLTDNSIIAYNVFGLIHYSRDGSYINTIVKNEFTKIEVTPNYIMSYYNMTFIGALSPNIKTSGNKLFYSYLNNIAGQEYLMEYDCSELQLNQSLKYDPEFPDKIIGSGMIIGDLNHGKAKYTPDKRIPGAEIYTIQATGMSWIDDNFYMKKLKDDEMMAIFNKDGDTLSAFTQHEKLINYTKNLQRGVDNGEQYEFNGKSFFRNAFNDTVFQVIPPNRLLPVYVFNLGKYKVGRQQGVDPGFDLTGKIIPQDWAETDKYIFITFVKDNYDCPNNRKAKSVKIYHAIYSKSNKQLSVFKGDPFDYTSEIVENNIDGGIPVWPSSAQIGKNGEILISLKGKALKERVSSEKFRNSTAPETKKQELKKFADTVTETEDILMIIK
jgi:hypothetical protein